MMFTELAKAGGSEVLADYSLGPVQSWRPLHGGMFLTPILLVTASGKYVLRGHRFRSSERCFRFQAETLDYLAERGFRCPRVIRDRLGRFGQNRESTFWAVHEYLEGHLYNWQDWHAAKSGHSFLEDVGFQVARIHDALVIANPTGDGTLSPALPPIQFRCLGAIRQQWDYDLECIESLPFKSVQVLLGSRHKIQEHWDWLTQQVSDLAMNRLPHQLVHGDVSPVNMIFSPSGNSLALIDWDCLHRGLRLYDALGDVLNRPPVELAEVASFDIDEIKTYLNGYQRGTAKRLERAELLCVPTFCLARQLEDLRQRVRVIPQLTPEQDSKFEVLIRGRIRIMSEIRSFAEEGFLWAA